MQNKILIIKISQIIEFKKKKTKKENKTKTIVLGRHHLVSYNESFLKDKIEFDNHIDFDTM